MIGCGRLARRAVPALAALGIAGALGGTLYAGYWYVTTSSHFAITTIEVQGNHALTADEVRALLTARIGDNLFTTDVHMEAVAVRAEPWVARAEVRRELPHTLVVEIEERRAAAIVMLGGAYLADATGAPFRRGDDDELDPALPTITGLDRDAFTRDPDTGAAIVRGALAAFTAWRTVAVRPLVGEVLVDAHGAVTLRTRATGMAIHLGALLAGGSAPDPELLAARLRRFDLAWNHLTADERARARTIHVDHTSRADHVVVAFAPEAEPDRPLPLED